MNATVSSGGEAPRIYWQQWLGEGGRRELITSSVLLKLSQQARAQNVCDLMIETLKLNKEKSIGSLVLVGTLFSLPRSFVHFEHERSLWQPSLGNAALTDQQQHTQQSEERQMRSPVEQQSRSEPVHIVRTLRPSDFPLEIEMSMAQHLSQLQQQSTTVNQQRSIISPKLRWYFVSSYNGIVTNHDSSRPFLPSCIEMDGGYCTSMEEEDVDQASEHDDETKSNKTDADNKGLDLVETMMSRFSWLHFRSGHVPQARDRNTSLCEQFAQCQSYKPERPFAGFLDKQSLHDRNVWRRTHCVITDEYLWFVTRVYASIGRPRYGRIRLTRALLLEPTPDYPSLHGVPNSFEVVTAKGNTHAFRAASAYLHSVWLRALSHRIVQSFENSMLDSSQLIIADECKARSGRMAAVAADSLWNTLAPTADEEIQFANTTKSAVAAVIRWAIDVAEYRESCRYIQALLPPRASAVVAGELGQTSVDPPSITASGNNDHLLEYLRGCWTFASALLARGTHAALQFYPELPRGLDTICRHVDFVITGRLKKHDLTHAHVQSHATWDPPPIDLFDHLLKELQLLAASLPDSLAEDGVYSDCGEAKSSGSNDVMSF